MGNGSQRINAKQEFHLMSGEKVGTSKIFIQKTGFIPFQAFLGIVKHAQQKLKQKNLAGSGPLSETWVGNLSQGEADLKIFHHHGQGLLFLWLKPRLSPKANNWGLSCHL